MNQINGMDFVYACKIRAHEKQLIEAHYTLRQAFKIICDLSGTISIKLSIKKGKGYEDDIKTTSA